MADEPRLYRSAHSYGKADRDGFIHRSWMKAQGFPEDVFDGRPIIGICNTWSELTPCNSHLREVADYVKRGVWTRRSQVPERGYLKLHDAHVLQADRGCDLDFLVGASGDTVLRESH